MKSSLIVTLILTALVIGASAQAPVVLRGPYLQLKTPTGITVRWRTNVPTGSVVSYGTAPGALTQTVANVAATTEHEVQLTGLTPHTRYWYAIGDASGTLAGNDAQHVFRTAPPVGSREPTRIWVIGDSGTGGASARFVRDSYLTFTGARETDVWLMLGDNAYPSGTDAQYQAAVFQNMYEPLLRQTAVWPTLGNHDVIDAFLTQTIPAYAHIFNLPTQAEAGGVASATEAYYSFDHANIHFVVLDSQVSDRSPGGAMLTWLAADLAATTQEWIIAYWHHPPYSRGSHDSDIEPAMVSMRQNALPVLEAGGVDLVLTGHSHDYERSMLIDSHYGLSATFDPSTMAVDTGDGRIGGDGAYQKALPVPVPHEGAIYVVAGSSGALSLGTPLDHPVMVTGLAVLGSVVIDVVGDQLSLLFLDALGVVEDRFTLVKDGVTPIETLHAPILPAGLWRYDDTGADLGTAWRAAPFDDSAWSVGQAPLGYGEPIVNTPVSFGGNPANVHPTTYFRYTFTVDARPPTLDSFLLAANYDDGFVAYLNGQEILRAAMPAGPIGYATLATAHESGAYQVFDLSEHAAALVAGPNVLAVEVHQATPSSSDLVFDAVLSFQGFAPFLGDCAAGTVGAAQGAPVDVLFVNGSAGGVGRSVDIGLSQPVTIAMAQPPTSAAPANFLLFGVIRTPGASLAFPLPANLGAMCFPPSLLAPGLPGLFLLTNSFAPGFSGAFVDSTATPWSETSAIGLPFPFEFTFQGIITATPTSLAITNAVRVAFTP